MTNKGSLIVGVPVSEEKLRSYGMPPYTPYPGSEERPCCQCGELLHVGPRQCEVADRADCPIVCPECALKGGADFANMKHLGNTHGPKI